MINKLPRWAITDMHPCMYDTESATTIEMTARLYGKMNELIENYNKYVDDLNKSIEEFEKTLTDENEIFRVGMRQEFQDFIDKVELLVMNQNRVLDEATKFMKDNLSESVLLTFQDMIANGEITVGVHYDSDTESLSIAMGGEV